MKRLMSALLAGAMVLGMTVTSFAAISKIADINPNFTLDGYNANNSAKGYSGYSVVVKSQGKNYNVTPTELASRDAKPDDEIRIYLKPEVFVDSDKKPVGQSWDKSKTVDIVTTSALRSGKVSVRRSGSKGKDLVESVSLANDKTNGAYIKVKFNEYFVSTKEKDFEFKLYLTVNNKKRNATQLTISGTMENDIINVDDGDDYVYMGDGEVVEADAYVRRIDCDLGNGVVITTSMNKGSKYYGVADTTPTAADEQVMDRNSAVDVVYTMKTVNLKKSNTKNVTFDVDYTYYVYNSSGTYLGTTDEKLAYSDKYYLCSTKVASVNVTKA